MITEVPTLSPTTTIGEVGQLLERNAKNYKNLIAAINDVYLS